MTAIIDTTQCTNIATWHPPIPNPSIVQTLGKLMGNIGGKGKKSVYE